MGEDGLDPDRHRVGLKKPVGNLGDGVKTVGEDGDANLLDSTFSRCPVNVDNNGSVFGGGGSERCYTRTRAGSEDGFQEEEFITDSGR